MGSEGSKKTGEFRVLTRGVRLYSGGGGGVGGRDVQRTNRTLKLG